MKILAWSSPPVFKSWCCTGYPHLPPLEFHQEKFSRETGGAVLPNSRAPISDLHITNHSCSNFQENDRTRHDQRILPDKHKHTSLDQACHSRFPIITLMNERKLQVPILQPAAYPQSLPIRERCCTSWGAENVEYVIRPEKRARCGFTFLGFNRWREKKGIDEDDLDQNRTLVTTPKSDKRGARKTKAN
jgi:hypothetical protein